MFKTTHQSDLEAQELAAAAAAFPEAVQQGLASLFAPYLRPGESVPDLLFAQELIRRVLTAKSAGLQQADQAHTGELVSHAGLRDRRDRHAAALRKLLRETRFFLDRALGGAVVREILPVRRLSNMKPALLALSARRAVAALRDPALGWESRQDDGFAPPAEIAAALDAAVAPLEETLDLLSQQSRATEDELGAKWAELDEAADLTRRCRKFLEGLYRLAGLDFHADRLAQPRRRKKQKA